MNFEVICSNKYRKLMIILESRNVFDKYKFPNPTLDFIHGLLVTKIKQFNFNPWFQLWGTPVCFFHPFLPYFQKYQFVNKFPRSTSN